MYRYHTALKAQVLHTVLASSHDSSEFACLSEVIVGSASSAPIHSEGVHTVGGTLPSIDKQQVVDEHASIGIKRHLEEHERASDSTDSGEDTVASKARQKYLEVEPEPMSGTSESSRASEGSAGESKLADFDVRGPYDSSGCSVGDRLHVLRQQRSGSSGSESDIAQQVHAEYSSLLRGVDHQDDIDSYDPEGVQCSHSLQHDTGDRKSPVWTSSPEHSRGSSKTSSPQTASPCHKKCADRTSSEEVKSSPGSTPRSGSPAIRQMSEGCKHNETSGHDTFEEEPERGGKCMSPVHKVAGTSSSDEARSSPSSSPRSCPSLRKPSQDTEPPSSHQQSGPRQQCSEGFSSDEQLGSRQGPELGLETASYSAVDHEVSTEMIQSQMKHCDTAPEYPKDEDTARQTWEAVPIPEPRHEAGGDEEEDNVNKGIPGQQADWHVKKVTAREGGSDADIGSDTKTDEPGETMHKHETYKIEMHGGKDDEDEEMKIEIQETIGTPRSADDTYSDSEDEEGGGLKQCVVRSSSRSPSSSESEADARDRGPEESPGKKEGCLAESTGSIWKQSSVTSADSEALHLVGDGNETHDMEPVGVQAKPLQYQSVDTVTEEDDFVTGESHSVPESEGSDLDGSAASLHHEEMGTSFQYTEMRGGHDDDDGSAVLQSTYTLDGMGGGGSLNSTYTIDDGDVQLNTELRCVSEEDNQPSRIVEQTVKMTVTKSVISHTQVMSGPDNAHLHIKDEYITEDVVEDVTEEITEDITEKQHLGVASLHDPNHHSSSGVDSDTDSTDNQDYLSNTPEVQALIGSPQNLPDPEPLAAHGYCAEYESESDSEQGDARSKGRPGPDSLLHVMTASTTATEEPVPHSYQSQPEEVTPELGSDDHESSAEHVNITRHVKARV